MSKIPANPEAIAIDKQEWQESIDYIHRQYGESGVREILRAIQDRVIGAGINLNEATLNTPYINTIPVNEQPAYPGDIALEKKIENINRWNAMAMVLQGADSGLGVGGHIATYASAATVMEVGYNHFFRKRSDSYGGDLVMTQPHAAPGVYARAFLAGRLSQEQLANFRRQLHPSGGLSSYPHPRLMPDFWEVPNASMGLSTPTAIYQARFAKYLENRGLKAKNGGKIWCFIGDGEADEPEVLGTINIAAREKLDNLVLVINCNLQRLDGPVRGNGKIIQELERSFRGADWNVLKVIWGSGWDGLLAQDSEGILRQRMEEAVDGDYQYYSVSKGDIQREHWVENSPELEQMMNSLTDDEIRQIKRGGQDPKKVFAAFQRAAESDGRPSVILVKTVKGEGMGEGGQGRNTSHQKKTMSAEERRACAQEFGIPLSPKEIEAAAFYRPDENSPELQYLREHREALGGYLPERRVDCPAIKAPPLSIFQPVINGSGDRQQSSTTAMVRILATLMKDKKIGRYIVPIVPDEARTFGMDGLFNVAGIYSPEGQNYTPVDAHTLVPYKETVDGQILQEGICETGAMASFLSAGTAYAIHGVPTIPFYIFYSMFGFQRVGDMIWSCGDMLCRGFLLGGTAGRTTLNGEGLQHQDGHSQIIASTVPNLKSYDPAFGYEVAVIVREGIKRMYEQQENIFYYLTLYNENHQMPAMPDSPAIPDNNGDGSNGTIAAGILQGAYCFKRTEEATGPIVNLLASGAIMQQALSAATQLEALGYAVNIYSVTSYNELYREAVAVDRWNRLHPEEQPRQCYIKQLFAAQGGVFIAASDYMTSLANSIALWMPEHFTALGTDGYGLSESREALRDYFEVSATFIIQAALHQLYSSAAIDLNTLRQQLEPLAIDAEKYYSAER
ncbi:MAG: pyruvate dehydrogenase (acetyl-transferring), homodimeric type [Gammaproteobacteria bacterium]|nr:pyruvate dehydrogenase (acetyl-transferring), homodimeric type [Gammaproteobacteria bacterium]MBQ0838350.1 pyruvate dehydrogenase (acetyl-transferring), homodimeric type [Gammaproteobacteria bacterium]